MNIKASVWVRTAVLAVALLNQVLTALGICPLPFSDEQVYGGVSALVTALSALWAWWKNNSFTAAARQGDKLMQALKEEAK